MSASPPQPQAEPLPVRHRRLAMRSHRRGTREMDLILGPFAEARLAALTPEALDRYERLLGENDQDLYIWVSGQRPVPEIHRAILGEIAGFHRLAPPH